jgi:hypothetical protein
MDQLPTLYAESTRAADGFARGVFTVHDVRRMIDVGVIGEEERIAFTGFLATAPALSAGGSHATPLAGIRQHEQVQTGEKEHGEREQRQETHPDGICLLYCGDDVHDEGCRKGQLTASGGSAEPICSSSMGPPRRRARSGPHPESLAGKDRRHCSAFQPPHAEVLSWTKSRKASKHAPRRRWRPLDHPSRRVATRRSSG